MILGYVIVNEQNEYYAPDARSGGYGYWSHIFTSAKVFKSYEEATLFRIDITAKNMYVKQIVLQSI